MIEINSDNNDSNSDEFDIADFAKYPQKNTKKIRSKKDIKIAKKRTTFENDENGIVDESCYDYVVNPKSVHFIAADRFDILIIKEILQEPNIQTFEISMNLNIPLSIAHKKRRLIESSLLTKKYFVDLTKLGIDLRFADIFAEIREDKVNDFVNKLYSSPLRQNILSISKVKNDLKGICIKAAYRYSSELFFLMDTIKSNPFISNVHFSEETELLKDNTLDVILNLLNRDY
ncbi:MAG TPA: hypothetical protein VJU13_06465 [Candidatus Nitrosocosmicus sp.]|nr:hypothetical protein [Candidatus Nitrosocosmicus sp.]